MTSELPPISFIIPFYKAESTLLNAIRSIFAQTQQDWELILIDDGSTARSLNTDRSLELAHSINDPRVTVFSDGENKRLAARLNQISSFVTNDYLARMGADDLVSTGICSLTDKYQPLGFRTITENYELTKKSMLLVTSSIIHASLVGKKAWFKRNRYREDGNVTLSKLNTAYSEIIKTIIEDSGKGFTIREKAQGLSLTLTKLLIAQALSISGSLGYLRNRRIGQALTTQQKENLEKEIQAILDLSLPL